MFRGMYHFKLTGRNGTADGALVFDRGRVFGSDGGVHYDGTYETRVDQSDVAIVRLKVTVPPGIELIMGRPVAQHERRFDVETTIQANAETPVRISTPDGEVAGFIRFVRDIPSDLAE